MANRFPFSGGLCPQKGRSGPSWGVIVRQGWYYGPTCSAKFWLLCDKYGSRDAQISPFWGDFGPQRGPLGGRFEHLYCSYALPVPHLFKFWSIWDNSNGRHTQISNFPLWDILPAIHLSHLPTYLSRSLRTTLAVTIMCFATRIKNKRSLQK